MYLTRLLNRLDRNNIIPSYIKLFPLTSFSNVTYRHRSTSNKKKMEDGLSPKDNYLRNFTYQGPEISVAEAKDIMSQFLYDTSSVDLETGENGIVKVRLNNPRARNAINGISTIINNCLFYHYYY